MRNLVTSLLLLASLASASAEEPPPSPPSAETRETLESVLVTGAGTSVVASRDVIRNAVAEFERWRARYAPNARFFLRVIEDGGPDPQGRPLIMSIATADSAAASVLHADASGRFNAQELAARMVEEDAQLSVNRGKGKVKLRAQVRTAPESTTQIRMGDLRLECRVNWQLLKGEAPLAIRLMFSAAGACTTKRISVSAMVLPAASRARLVEGARSIDMGLSKNGRSIEGFPYYDESWSNEALVLLEPKTE